MSTVKVEPFFFQEDGIQIAPNSLPGAVEENKDTQKETPETQAKPENTSEDDNSSEGVINTGFSFEKPEVQIEETEEEEKETEKITSDKVEYKAISDFLIESGIWKDFEGKEDFEFNEESFQTMWEAQAKNQAAEILQEEKAQFGDTANQFIDYLKSGGTVDTFVENYSQQLDIQSIDITDEDGQEKIVKEYYESIGWKPEKIKKHIERIKDEVELKEEAEDCKSKLVEAIASEREEMIKEQEAIQKDKKLKFERFNKAVRETFYKDTTLAEREKKDLDKFVFDYKYQDQAGNRYSEFATKWNEINSDPTKYAKFLKFVKNFDSFEDKKETAKEENRKNFSFLKKGTSLENVVSQEPVKQRSNKTPGGIVFK